MGRAVVGALMLALFLGVLAGCAGSNPAATHVPPATPRAFSGTYWTCESNVSDSGQVDTREPPPRSGIRSALCTTTYGETQPGQTPPPLLPGEVVWQVPVGTFSPFRHCGHTVSNIVDPYDMKTAPRDWLGYREFLFDAGWRAIPEGAC